MSLVVRDTLEHLLVAANTAATESVNAGTGSDRGLVAFAYWRTNGGHTWSGVTYDGVSLTSRAIIESGTQYRMQVWTLDGPSTGTNDLVFTPTGGTGDAAGCVIGYCFMEDVDMAQWLTDIATDFETGSNNAAGASFKSVEDVAGESGGFGLFVAGIRDGGGAPTATPDALVGTLDQGTSGAQFAVAQGNWTSDGGTDSPSVDWDNDGGDLERRFAMVFHSTAAAESAALTGTGQPSATETEIVDGGRTFIITLTGDTWIAAGTGPIGTTAQSESLIDGFNSAQAEAAGWDARIAANDVAATDLVRTSATVATLTLPAMASYAITATETITITIPAALLTTRATDLVVTETFQITADAAAGNLPLLQAIGEA